MRMTYASRVRAGTWVGPALLAFIVTAFLAYSLPRYFTGDPGQSLVPATFGLHYPLLVAHVTFATVAMVSAVAQIWPGLRVRHPVLHRRTGRVYVAAAVPAGWCALIIGAATPFGPIVMASDVAGASLWLWFTINGYLAGRQRRFAMHRRHMVRSATLALSVITNRIWTPVLFIALQPLHDSVFHGDDVRFLWVVAGLGGWLGWTIPLLGVQRWLGRKVVMAPSSISQQMDTPRCNVRAIVEHAAMHLSERGQGHGDGVQRQDRAGYS
jgi:hypothetical protein